MSQGINNGWIKLHRSMLDNPTIMKDTERIAIWIYLLLSATHSDIDVIFGGERITLHPGQLITGRKKIAHELNVNESKVERVLNRFETEHQIEQRKTRQNRLITILKWELYQQIEQPIEQQVNNDRTTSEQQVNTNKNIRMKECKNNRDIYNAHFENVWKIYPRKKDKARSFQCYMARINSGYSEDELYEATKNYAEECRREDRPEKYIKLATTFYGVNTPFVDYLPKQDQKTEMSSSKIFDTQEQYKAPYFGFPAEWFNGTELDDEKVRPVIRARDTSMGWYEDTELSVKELIDEYMARRTYYEQQNNGG